MNNNLILKIDEMDYYAYSSWEDEWISHDDTYTRRDSLKACQQWLDLHIPGTQVIDAIDSKSCHLLFKSLEDRARFVLTWL